MSDIHTTAASSPRSVVYESEDDEWTHPLEECVLVDIESLITEDICEDTDVTRPLLSFQASSLRISLLGEQV